MYIDSEAGNNGKQLFWRVKQCLIKLYKVTKICQRYDIKNARLFDYPNTEYNIIFGIDFVQKYKIRFYFDTNAVEWLGEKIEIKPVNYFNTMFNKRMDIWDCKTQPGDS